jgi:ABC-type dipeptide/oligopeptide/nickel transport system permease component
MLRYIGQRLALSIPVVLSVVSVVFLAIRVLPGDPAQAALGENASHQAVQTLRTRLGLDEPLPIQYLRFLGDLLHGNLGTSMLTGASVRDQVMYHLPFTLELTLVALLIGTALGVPVGVWTATQRTGAIDVLGRLLSLAGVCVPAFYLGILLILLFGAELGWLPAIGGGDPNAPADVVVHLVLPGLTLGLIMTASVTRLTRAAVLEVGAHDYVRTARAKGVHERLVIVVHTLRPALLPIVSLMGVWAVALVGDSVTTELVFARPGLGKLMVGAMLQRDYTTLQSVMVVYTLFVVGINLITDIAYGVVDPRIRR